MDQTIRQRVTDGSEITWNIKISCTLSAKKIYGGETGSRLGDPFCENRRNVDKWVHACMGLLFEKNCIEADVGTHTHFQTVLEMKPGPIHTNVSIRR